MTEKETRLVFLGIVLAVAVLATCFMFNIGMFELPTLYIPFVKKEITPPPATGNVDDLMEAILKEVSDEQSVFSEEEDDSSLINNYNAEIGNFGTLVNENEL